VAGNVSELRAIRRPDSSWLFLVIAMLGACRTSPAVRFYTLDPVHGERTQGQNRGGPVQVAAVHVPPTLDRREMVRESAPNRLSVSSENRWAASLAEISRKTLTQDLSARLPPGRVLFSDAPAPTGALTIVLDVLSFERNSSGTAIFEGSWSLFPSGSDTPVMRHDFKLAEDTHSSDYAEQARVMSVLLGRVSDQIADALH
jgi:uncharacterized protein